MLQVCYEASDYGQYYVTEFWSINRKHQSWSYDKQTCKTVLVYESNKEDSKRTQHQIPAENSNSGSTVQN